MMNFEKKGSWGGKRPGAGRKSEADKPTKYVGLRLTEEEHKKLKELGGSSAVRAWIRASMKSPITNL